MAAGLGVPERLDIVVVTGLSGSGKSVAIRVLEEGHRERTDAQC